MTVAAYMADVTHFFYMTAWGSAKSVTLTNHTSLARLACHATHHGAAARLNPELPVLPCCCATGLRLRMGSPRLTWWGYTWWIRTHTPSRSPRMEGATSEQQCDCWPAASTGHTKATVAAVCARLLGTASPTGLVRRLQDSVGSLHTSWYWKGLCTAGASLTLSLRGCC